MVYTFRFFLFKCSLFHNANLFRPCIIHILYTGCAKIKKNNNSGAKGLNKLNSLTLQLFIEQTFSTQTRTTNYYWLTPKPPTTTLHA